MPAHLLECSSSGAPATTSAPSGNASRKDSAPISPRLARRSRQQLLAPRQRRVEPCWKSIRNDRPAHAVRKPWRAPDCLPGRPRNDSDRKHKPQPRPVHARPRGLMPLRPPTAICRPVLNRRPALKTRLEPNSELRRTNSPGPRPRPRRYVAFSIAYHLRARSYSRNRPKPAGP